MGQLIETFPGVFMFYGKVATVVVYTYVPAKRFSSLSQGRQLIEEGERFRSGLEKTQWFRLESEMKIQVLGLPDPVHFIRAEQQVLVNLGRGRSFGVEFLEGTREGADASLFAGLQQLGQNLEEEDGVLEPFRGSSVRSVDVFLDPLPVEIAVGKSVNGEDVTVLGLQPFLKAKHFRLGGKLACSLRAQPKADGKLVLG